MPITLDDFAAGAVSSGLVPEDELSAVLTANPGLDAEKLAKELVRQKKLTAFQAKQLWAGKGPSLTIGNYVILDKLGQGGMGMVLKAQHKRMKRVVALKVLSPSVTKTKEMVQRFQREVETVGKLDHPNVVAAYDADEANGTHFLVMQYVEGQDLSGLVKEKGTLPVDKAVQCIVQAARGLEYAHQKGVIHRDIKPANLLLDTQGTIKILDMGLARIATETAEEGLTQTGAIMGTIDYMAPEQAVNTKLADARSDIYSLGITLWYLLTGRAAYPGESMMSKLLAHRESPIPSLAAARPDVPAALDAVFQKMIAKKPEGRYQTMTEVLAALETCLQPGAQPPSLVKVKSEESKLSDLFRHIGEDSTTRAGKSKTKDLASNQTVSVSAADELTSMAEAPSTRRRGSAEPTVRRRSAPRKASGLSTQQLVIGAAGLGAVILIGIVVANLLSRTDPNPNTGPITSTSPDSQPDEPESTTGSPAVEAQPPQAQAPEWEPLLNGRDLSGWTQKGHPGWTYGNGLLAGETTIGNPGFLVSDEEFGDYELDLEYKLTAGSNSGIFLRCDPTGPISGAQFTEIQLLDDGGQPNAGVKNRTGSIFNHTAPVPAPNAPPYEWHRVQVRVEGQRVQITFNGTPILDAEDQRLKVRGHIGLQLYPTRVEFRNIRLRRLGEKSTASDWRPLFNGRDLGGWSVKGDPGWTVRGGIMMGDTTAGRGGFLVSDEAFDNFELDFEYKLESSTNSGVFLRCDPNGDLSGRDFAELQLLDDSGFTSAPSMNRTGSLVNRVAPNPAPRGTPHVWHRVLVKVVGQRIRVTFDGTEVLDTETRLPARGHIGLQLKPSHVEFRNMRVRIATG